MTTLNRHLNTIWMSVVAACLLASCGAPPTPGADKTVIGTALHIDNRAPLIPRSVLMGNPDRAAPMLSPNGESLSFLAPVDGVLNVWVGPANDPSAARPVTNDTVRGIRKYFWSYLEDRIVYLQDSAGDENWHVYLVDLTKNETTDLTPIEGVQARIDGVSHKIPEEILVGLNDRDPKLHDVWKLNLVTGKKKIVVKNTGYAGFVSDDDYNVRFAIEMTQDGGSELFEPGKKGKWKSFMNISMEDALTTTPIDFDKSGRVLYMLDSRERNTAAFVTINLDSGERKIIAEDSRADLSGLMIHPTEKTVEAAEFTYARKELKIIDQSVANDFDALKKVHAGDIDVGSRTLDDRQWIVAFVEDAGPIRYYRWDRDAMAAQFLFTNRTALEDADLVSMLPEIIKTRDGLTLVNYLSLPDGSDSDGDGRPDKPLPMILRVHGGPWHRVSWGYDAHHQWLANRGYAVLSVNFRSSTGFGKEFINAGNMEWAGKMHDDLIDSVNWAIEQKIADPGRIAVFGGSYGGFATLVALTFTPDVFAGGVDIVGPSNLVTLLETIPPYWAPMIELFTKRVGDHRTEDGKAFLLERSPLTHVDRILRPLLIAQGANDPRVKQSESDQIVDAMKKKNIPVTYVLYPDEGHGFARHPNRLSFYAVTEAFLAGLLGGRAQPIGEDFLDSSITVPQGADDILGLKEALAGK